MIKVIAVGRLTKDAEVFTYGQGKSGINFGMACNKNGSDDATFIQCTKFGSDENLAQYLKMGNQLIVNGDLDIKNDGNGNYYTKIIVHEIEFGAKKLNSNYGDNGRYSGNVPY